MAERHGSSERLLSVNDVSRLLRYDPDSGALYWISRTAQRIRIGDRAGVIREGGYRQIRLFARWYKEHRLAWLLANGDWPEGEIDHINGVSGDNRLVNLRVASRTLNAQNIRQAHSTNLSCGLLGVTWCKKNKRWRASIFYLGKKRHLGYHASAEAAHEAYLKAKREHHAGCTI